MPPLRARTALPGATRCNRRRWPARSMQNGLYIGFILVYILVYIYLGKPCIGLYIGEYWRLPALHELITWHSETPTPGGRGAPGWPGTLSAAAASELPYALGGGGDSGPCESTPPSALVSGVPRGAEIALRAWAGPRGLEVTLPAWPGPGPGPAPRPPGARPARPRKCKF